MVKNTCSHQASSRPWNRGARRYANHSFGAILVISTEMLLSSDLHAAPGAQNKYDHSGTPGGHCNFWTPSNTAATVRVLQALALALHPIPNVIGLQLMNEPDNENGLQSWYESTIASIRGVLSAAYANNSGDDLPPATEFPVFIDDARDPSWYSQWVGRRDDFVIMDRHIYRCFTSQDSHQSGEEHAAGIRASTHGELQKFSDIAHGSVIVGEWSAGLGNEGMPNGSNAGEQDRQRRVFVQAQREVFNKTCAGQFFWCYKKGQGWDAGWSARDASLAAILPEWVGGPAVQLRGDDEKESAMEKARSKHIGVGAPCVAIHAETYVSSRCAPRVLDTAWVQAQRALAVRRWVPPRMGARETVRLLATRVQTPMAARPDPGACQAEGDKRQCLGVHARFRAGLRYRVARMITNETFRVTEIVRRVKKNSLIRT